MTSREKWEKFKQGHPERSLISGVITAVQHFGVFVDCGAPCDALLLVPYIAPIDCAKYFPADYPHVGEKISAWIVRHIDPTETQDPKIGLTQIPPESREWDKAHGWSATQL